MYLTLIYIDEMADSTFLRQKKKSEELTYLRRPASVRVYLHEPPIPMHFNTALSSAMTYKFASNIMT